MSGSPELSYRNKVVNFLIQVLQEQQELLKAEPSLQPHPTSLYSTALERREYRVGRLMKAHPLSSEDRLINRYVL